MEVERKQVLAQCKKVSSNSTIIGKGFSPSNELVLCRDARLSGVAVGSTVSVGGEAVLTTSVVPPNPGTVRLSDTS